jgi:hypothetical protein
VLRAGHLLAVAHAALIVGIGDQQPSAFSDARLLGLGMNPARLIVPWNAATTEPASVQAWLDAAAAAGMTPHVAFEHLRTDHCPGRPCVLPTRAQCGAAARAFIARFPQVRTYTAWNEANHASQPVAQHPEAAAGYYEELRSACPTCTIVAGDVLDSGLVRALAAAIPGGDRDASAPVGAAQLRRRDLRAHERHRRGAAHGAGNAVDRGDRRPRGAAQQRRPGDAARRPPPPAHAPRLARRLAPVRGLALTAPSTDKRV